MMAATPEDWVLRIRSFYPGTAGDRFFCLREVISALSWGSQLCVEDQLDSYTSKAGLEPFDHPLLGHGLVVLPRSIEPGREGPIVQVVISMGHNGELYATDVGSGLPTEVRSTSATPTSSPSTSSPSSTPSSNILEPGRPYRLISGDQIYLGVNATSNLQGHLMTVDIRYPPFGTTAEPTESRYLDRHSSQLVEYMLGGQSGERRFYRLCKEARGVLSGAKISSADYWARWDARQRASYDRWMSRYEEDEGDYGDSDDSSESELDDALMERFSGLEVTEDPEPYIPSSAKKVTGKRARLSQKGRGGE